MTLRQIPAVFKVCFAASFLMLSGCSQIADLSGKEKLFVRLSPRDARYLELSDGSPYIPIGLNVIHPTVEHDEQQGLAQMADWIEKLSHNRGNYIRIWLSQSFWDIEHDRSGQYDISRAKLIDALLEMARLHNIRVKLTLEHFRHFDLEKHGRFAYKPLHHVSRGGTAQSITDFFTGRVSREQFKRKLDWYAARYGDDPVIYGWELWNEINAVAGEGWLEWTDMMLAELHKRFPKNLAMQSLGSFDEENKRPFYRSVSLMKGNDIAQVHRYLDLGAELEICHGPVDVIAASAIRDIQAYNPQKPIILAETGAVEPSHSGSFKLYKQDKDGIILHDILFASFFAGSAGTGQIWHWSNYVDRLNLWYHFARFAEAVKELDPPAEGFEPMMLRHPRLRIYALKGEKTFVAWCRDKENNWRGELQHGKAPRCISNAAIDLNQAGLSLKNKSVKVYDPWKDRWETPKLIANRIILPDFFRSVMIRID